MQTFLLVQLVTLADTDEVGLGHVDPDDPSIFIVDTGLEWPEDGNESLLPALDTVVVGHSHLAGWSL